MHDLLTYGSGLMPSKHQLIGPFVVAAVCMVAISGVSSSQITPTSCRGPDKFSNYHITHLQGLMQSANPLDSAFLRRVHLPRVASTAVQLVTADSVCSRAVAAWTAIDTTTIPPLASLYVIRVGSTYDVIDPQHSGAEWSQHLVLDRLFHPLGHYLF